MNINSVELLNDAGSEYTSGTKLHFKIRMKAKDYKGALLCLASSRPRYCVSLLTKFLPSDLLAFCADVTAMHYASEDIVVTVRDSSFGTKLVRALDAASKRTTDWPHLSRFGWMFGADIEVLSAIAMPTSGIRAPMGEEGATPTDDDTDAWNLRQANLLLIGVGLTAVLLLCIVIYMYLELRKAHALYEKDKGTLSQSGQVLHRMFNTLASQAAEGIAATAGVQVNVGGAGSSASSQQQREVELAQQRGLMDEDLED